MLLENAIEENIVNFNLCTYCVGGESRIQEFLVGFTFQIAVTVDVEMNNSSFTTIFVSCMLFIPFIFVAIVLSKYVTLSTTVASFNLPRYPLNYSNCKTNGKPRNAKWSQNDNVCFFILSILMIHMVT